MKSKVLVCGALAAALTMSVVLPGCANATRNEEDMNQIIATVDITKSDMLAQEGLAEYASCIAPENIIKRDLMAAYYNVGYSYIQSGSSVAEVFEMLVKALTSTAVVSQYATLSLIADKCESDSSFLQKYNAAESDVEKYELLLEGETAESDDGESSRVLLARYSFYSSINSSIDSIEQGIIDEDEDDSSSSGETRTVPTETSTTASTPAIPAKVTAISSATAARMPTTNSKALRNLPAAAPMLRVSQGYKTTSSSAKTRTCET